MDNANVVKQIKSVAYKKILLGLIIMVLTAFIASIWYAEGGDGVIFWAVIILFGLIILIKGVIQSNPRKSPFMRDNPYIMEQADRLYNNMEYTNSVIMCCNQYVASKKNILTITPLSDVIGVYHKKVDKYYSFIRYGSSNYVVIVTPKKDIEIKVGFNYKDDIETSMQAVYYRCPHIRVGFSAENATYFRNVQKEYKKQMKLNKKNMKHS